ncbi:MAG TPA: polysaccharide deacetylase family protein, partial [Gemmatimonadaceae bacterium]|nr:polysaccharide deacetylase family protein [Gemmatimonadaceae bacterium]
AVPAATHAVALTFDDGFANFASAAVPTLIKRHAPATVFVVPGYVGKSNDWESAAARSSIPHQPLMSWSEIGAVRSQGFEIGGHGTTHVSLRNADRQTLEREIVGCAATLEERVGASPSSFAFPYGHHDADAVAVAATTYSLACTTRFDFLTGSEGPHELPRLDMYYFRQGKMLARWGSPEFVAYVTARKVLRNARIAVRARSNRGRE